MSCTRAVSLLTWGMICKPRTVLIHEVDLSPELDADEFAPILQTQSTSVTPTIRVGSRNAPNPSLKVK